MTKTEAMQNWSEKTRWNLNIFANGHGGELNWRTKCCWCDDKIRPLHKVVGAWFNLTVEKKRERRAVLWVCQTKLWWIPAICRNPRTSVDILNAVVLLDPPWGRCMFEHLQDACSALRWLNDHGPPEVNDAGGDKQRIASSLRPGHIV